MQKYLQFYELMLNQHGPVFTAFKPIHDAYAADKDKNAAAFHKEGLKVLDIVRDWERRLCSGMEKGRYAAYSATLAEKFWGEVKKELPLIDEVGVKVSKAS